MLTLEVLLISTSRFTFATGMLTLDIESFACNGKYSNGARGHLISSEGGVRCDPPRLTTRENDATGIPIRR